MDLIRITLTLSDSAIGKGHTFVHNVIAIPNVGDIITVKLSPSIGVEYLDTDPDIGFKVIEVKHKLDGIRISDRYEHPTIAYYLEQNSHHKSSIHVICDRVG